MFGLKLRESCKQESGVWSFHRRIPELYLSKWMLFSKEMKEFKYCVAKSYDE